MKKYLPFLISICILLLLWQGITMFSLVPRFMLPGPKEVFHALQTDWKILLTYSQITLLEAFIGIFLSIVVAFIMSYAMLWDSLRATIYPLMVVSQTIPVIAIAPLLVLWFGYGILPKIMLIMLVCFFPLTVALIDGYQSVDKDILDLMHTFSASRKDIFIHVYWPTALPYFFSALKTAISYGIVGAVIAEWLGGSGGLGAYMTVVRKSYRYDKMFAVIFLITGLTMLLIGIIGSIEKRILKWKK